ncbi:MAG: carbamoyltransferase [Lentimonas sp.]|jgi:carbamoyltransferase
MTYILGISALYHDSAACLIKGEKIIAAAQEERFTRKKQDAAFPKEAIKYCLEEAGITLDEVSHFGFYDKPFLKFERLLETYLSETPRGFASFMMAIPVWLKEKLFLKDTLIKEFADLYDVKKEDKKAFKALKEKIASKLLFAEHHQSHASSAFYPSPFKDAAIINMDGVGEWVTTSIMKGNKNEMKVLKEVHFPHSIGLLYSAFTYYTGFKVNSGEYKLMGLAPYGQPKYAKIIKDNLLDIKSDGSFKLRMKYFNYTTGLTMTSKKFHDLFGRAPRKAETEISQFEMDMAASIQQVTEEIVIKLAKTAKKLTKSKNLCLSGGVALNCVANGKILKEKIFENIFIQPASGDAGGALGVAFSIYYQHLKNKRTTFENGKDNMQGSYLGVQCKNDQIQEYLDSVGAKYKKVKDKDELAQILAKEIADEKVIGWHQGRMEFGPRALGSRSIIGDPRSEKMQKIMNLKIKYRESFRPFAPAVLREDITKYFDIEDVDSPYMLMVAPINEKIKVKGSEEKQAKLFGIDKLNIKRSKLPAITHVDYSARLQTIHEDTNPRFHALISEFKKLTKCSVLINTSFNVRGEPIVCSSEDSYKCFMRTGMDVLAIEDFVLFKADQPKFEDGQDWQNEYELD